MELPCWFTFVEIIQQVLVGSDKKSRLGSGCLFPRMCIFLSSSLSLLRATKFTVLTVLFCEPMANSVLVVYSSLNNTLRERVALMVRFTKVAVPDHRHSCDAGLPVAGWHCSRIARLLGPPDS